MRAPDANDRAELAAAKAELPGKRVRLVHCADPYTTLTPGTLGTISLVDDIGTVHVDWDNGSKLGMCADDGDRWAVVGDFVDGPPAAARPVRYRVTLDAEQLATVQAALDCWHDLIEDDQAEGGVGDAALVSATQELCHRPEVL